MRPLQPLELRADFPVQPLGARKKWAQVLLPGTFEGILELALREDVGQSCPRPEIERGQVQAVFSNPEIIQSPVLLEEKCPQAHGKPFHGCWVSFGLLAHAVQARILPGHCLNFLVRRLVFGRALRPAVVRLAQFTVLGAELLRLASRQVPQLRASAVNTTDDAGAVITPSDVVEALVAKHSSGVWHEVPVLVSGGLWPPANVQAELVQG